MKFWRKLLQLQQEAGDRWSKKKAKLFSMLHMQQRVSPRPASLVMAICMPYMPIEIEGPTRDGSPVIVNPWDIKYEKTHSRASSAAAIHKEANKAEGPSRPGEAQTTEAQEST